VQFPAVKNLDFEEFLQKAQRELYAEAAVFGMIVALENLERVYVRDTINATECVYHHLIERTTIDIYLYSNMDQTYVAIYGDAQAHK
jgi:hypothetical protein